MQSMTIEQLRAACDAGGVQGVTLRGQGGAFFVEITTCGGTSALLVKAHGGEPHRFGSPAIALNVLRAVGITIGQFDVTEWNPAEREESPGNRRRTKAMRKAHQVATYTGWRAGGIQDVIDDPRPSIPHDDVMARMDARIAARKAAGSTRA